MKKVFILTIASLLLAFACTKESDRSGMIPEGKALLNIRPSLDLGKTDKATRATSTDIGDFTVIIKDNTTGTELVKQLISQGDGTYTLDPGFYTVTVTSHPDGIPAPALDVQVYTDQQTVTLTEGDSKNINLKCEQVNAGLYFVYEDISPEEQVVPKVIHTQGTLVYPANDQNAIGYFSPAVVEVSFTSDGNPIKVNGKDSESLELEAGDLWEIGVRNTGTARAGDLTLSIEIVKVEEPNKQLKFELGQEGEDVPFSVETTGGDLQALVEAAGRENTKEIVISGTLTGTDFDYLKNNMPELEYLDISGISTTTIPTGALQGKATIVEVVLPESLLEIGNNAFRNCSSLKNINIPLTLTTIGNSAFENCRALSGELVLGPELSSIGTSAFLNCGFTGSLTISDKITVIGTSTFSGCSFDGDLTLGDNVETIGNNAFRYCSFTGNLRIPDKVISIGTYAFQDCDFDGQLTLGSLLKTIRSYAFNGCGFTGNLVIPDSVDDIESYAFQECPFGGTLKLNSSLTELANYVFDGCTFSGPLEIPDNIIRLGTGVFRNCIFGGELSFGPQLANIGTNAFYGCSGLTGSLVLPDVLRTINSGVFYGCSGFEGQLSLGSAVTTISNDAFFGCSGFTGTLEIPSTVTASGLGMRSFAGCTALSSIKVYWDELSAIPTYRVNMFPENARITVPPGTLSEYQTKWAGRDADSDDAKWVITEE